MSMDLNKIKKGYIQYPIIKSVRLSMEDNDFITKNNFNLGEIIRQAILELKQTGKWKKR